MGFRTPLLMLAVAAGLLSAGTASAADKEPKKKRALAARRAGAGYARDWTRFPAIVERQTAAGIAALGDVHGGYQRLVALLHRAGIVQPAAGTPVGYSWSGGDRVLVCTGDLIDRGDESLPVLDLMMEIERQAPAAGGEVIVTLGNHEVEFLARPWKTKRFAAELRSKGLDPTEFATHGRYGTWMMNRPIAARVNAWFFTHGGNTSGRTLAEIGRSFRATVDAGAWDAPFLLGKDSMLVDQKWWTRRADVKADLAALGVRHIVFGHDPGAAESAAGGHRGAIREKYDGRIFAIDVGMSPAIDDSRGALLFISRQGGQEAAMSLGAGGEKRELWRGAVHAGTSGQPSTPGVQAPR